MNIRSSSTIDKTKWDALVHAEKASSVFSLSTYLDAIAENWCIFVDEEYTCGMAIPYINRLGKRIAYTPVFMRYCEWFGDSTRKSEAFRMIEQYFAAGNLNFREEESVSKSNLLLRFQSIEPGNWKTNDQVKRMLKRFAQSGMTIQRDGNIADVIKHIDSQLSNKIDGINKRSIERLVKLTNGLNKIGMLQVIAVFQERECVGGIFLVNNQHRTLYLKGTFTDNAKKQGAMYATMFAAIEESLKRELIFDFGGSNADGVRRFNLNLGGTDQYYSVLKWDNLPSWIVKIQRLVRWIKK